MYRTRGFFMPGQVGIVFWKLEFVGIFGIYLKLFWIFNLEFYIFIVAPWPCQHQKQIVTSDPSVIAPSWCTNAYAKKKHGYAQYGTRR